MDQWNAVVMAQYKQTMDGLSPDERKAEMQRIFDEFGAPSTVDNREPATRVKAYVKQLEQLVSWTRYLLSSILSYQAGPPGNLCSPYKWRH